MINVVPPLTSPDETSITSESTLVSPLSNYTSSPATTPSTGPGTIQHLTSQFIKEGLKMKVKQNMGGVGARSKRSRNTSSTRTSLNEGDTTVSDNKDALVSLLDMPSDVAGSQKQSTNHQLPSPTDSEQKYPVNVETIKKEELTIDDTLRRSRRRERNKVAATKCRNKKKARTQLLIRVNKLKII